MNIYIYILSRQSQNQSWDHQQTSRLYLSTHIAHANNDSNENSDDPTNHNINHPDNHLTDIDRIKGRQLKQYVLYAFHA